MSSLPATIKRLRSKAPAVKAWVIKHKIASVAITLAGLGVIAGVYQVANGDGSETRYALASVTRGDIVSTISGSGQVSASNQVDVKAKTSGDVVFVGVVAGQQVSSGKLLVQLDAASAARAVRDAQVNLESAQLSLQKLQKPADGLSLLQSENAVARANEARVTAQDNLIKAYDDGFTKVSDTFLDLPSVMTSLRDVLLMSSSQLPSGGSQTNIDYYADAAGQLNSMAESLKREIDISHEAARRAYDTNLAHYNSANRFSDRATVEALINETYDTTKLVADTIKLTSNLIQLYKDEFTKRSLVPASLASTHLATLASDTNTVNTNLSSLLTIKNSIKNSKDSISNAERTIAESSESLTKLKSGTDALDLQSAQLSLRARENALADARANYADAFVRAPFTGLLSKVAVKKGESVSSGTTIATLLTNEKIAEISLNEVDVAKVKAGQDVVLVFDAFPDEEVKGKVAEIDVAGTASQGVVTYTVKISFASTDDRVKPGMSVSATITTDVKKAVLYVPNAAVKTQGGEYVELLAKSASGANSTTTSMISADVYEASVARQQVTTGVSNDDVTEIVSGLSEGDKVVVRTVTVTAAQAAAGNAAFGAPRAGATGATRPTTGGNAQFRSR